MEDRFIRAEAGPVDLGHGYTLEHRQEIAGDKKWELKRGEGHVKLFTYPEDAVEWLREDLEEDASE